MASMFSARHRRALLVFAAATKAIPATAQERPPEPAAEPQVTPSAATRPVRLAIDGLAPGVEVRVIPKSAPPADEAKAASCTQDCELKLPKGPYTLIARRGDERRTKEVELTSAQLLTVGRWDSGARTIGTVMGITGVVMAAIGTFLTVAPMVWPPRIADGGINSSVEDSEARLTIAMLGLAGMLGGTGLAVAGFSLAAANRAPSMDLERMPMSRPPPPGASAGILLSGKF